MRNLKFERWFAKRQQLTHDQVKEMWTGETYRSLRYHVELAWAAWLAALGFTGACDEG